MGRCTTAWHAGLGSRARARPRAQRRPRARRRAATTSTSTATPTTAGRASPSSAPAGWARCSPSRSRAPAGRSPRWPVATKRGAAAFAELVPGARGFAEPQAVLDEADLIFLTVPDDADRRRRPPALHLYSGQALVHTSGALPASVLAPAMAAGTTRAASIRWSRSPTTSRRSATCTARRRARGRRVAPAAARRARRVDRRAAVRCPRAARPPITRRR